MHSGLIVLVLVRNGHLEEPLGNAVPSLAQWVDVVRGIVGDDYVGAVVTDTRRPALRPGATWPPMAPENETGVDSRDALT